MLLSWRGKYIENKNCLGALKQFASLDNRKKNGNKSFFFIFLQILDEVYRILHHIKVTPKLQRPYKVTDELFDLSTMAMEYFKEHIEPTLPEIPYFGADFLDLAGTFTCE